MAAITLLALDLTGKAIANRIVGEPHTLITVSRSKNRVIMLDRGGFYEDNLKVYDASGKSLTKGTDFVATYLYDDFAELTGMGVYGMIVVKNPLVSAQVTVDYRAVGGPFGLSVKELKALLDAVQDDRLTVKFSDISGRPREYIPADHTNEWWAVYGMESTIAELNRIRDTIGHGEEAVITSATDYGQVLIDECQKLIADYATAIAAHIADQSNPHAVTKAQIGLSNLFNWPIATDAQAVNPNQNALYLSPGNAYAILAAAYIPQLDAHIANKSNPHGVTAAQLSAYTKAQINSILNGYLNRDGTAINSNLIAGLSYNDMAWQIRQNIPVGNVVSGVFNPARLGNGGGSNDALLNGDQTYRSISSIFDRYDTGGGSGIFIGRFQGWTAAQNQLDANYTNLTSFPIGTFAFATILNVTQGGDSPNPGVDTTTELQYWQRTGSGWLRMSGSRINYG